VSKQTLGTIGRVLLLVAGICVVVLLVHRAGPEKVGAVLKDAWVFLPLIMLGEIGVLGCDVMSVRRQLGDHRFGVPLRSWIWSSTYAYALQILFPAGRAAGEVARISVLSRHVGVARCAVASVGFQASNLYAVATLSAFDAIVSYLFAGDRAHGLSLGAGLNVLLVGGIATFVTRILRSKRAAELVAKRFKLSDAWKGDLADATKNSLTIKRGAAWCTTGRFIQLAQYGVCVLAIGGTTGIVQATLAHGIQMVGASLGDVIPGQIGAVEGAYTAFAGAIHLPAERVLALPLLIRITQISLATACLVIATLMGRNKPGVATTDLART
jgi:uncharacterized membrane protein YbhN (UPF0104 family)